MRGLLSFALLALTTCGGSPDPASRSFRFEDGRRVVVWADERVDLELPDGRVVFSLPPLRGPIVSRYDLRVTGELGIWTFRERPQLDPAGNPIPMRTELTAAGVPRLTDDGAVELTYSGGEYGLRMVIREDGPERTRFRLELTAGEAVASSLVVPVRCEEGATFHGFGEQYNATDQRGEAFELFVSEQGVGRERGLRDIAGDSHTTYFPMPYWLDARGHGVLFLTDQRVKVSLCVPGPGNEINLRDEEVAFVEVAAIEPVEWLVFHGPTPLAVVRQLGDVVGRPAPLPDWAFGTWIASQGGQDSIEEEVANLEAAGVPWSALWVQDWTGIRRNIDGGFGVEYRWEADDELYPDLRAFVARLHADGKKFLAYANPFVDPSLPNHFPEMDERGLLVGHPDGGSYEFTAPNSPTLRAGHPDLTNPETVAYVKAALRAMVEDYGFDGWMHDFSEWNPIDAVMSDGSEPVGYHNRYPIEWQRMAREVLDETRPDGDYALFARAGWTGVQAVAQIHWAGDQECNWEHGDGLPTVVPALLNMGLSGQPNVTHDVAGFSGGPSTKELFLRWTELGAFTPIFRTHDGNRKLENWSWDTDEETVAHFRRFARIHDALAPLFRELADESQRTSAPILRHPMLVFPTDPRTWGLSQEMMIGETLYVAPVIEEGATTRTLYLPEGSWFHVWTGTRYEGGQTITVDAPIGAPPVFSLGEDRTDLRAIE
ncbi:MAG: hypothetical protein KF901_03335 [Myxococcales bacterium]|nr:hypothetical protein [Myxococcales bacterium]